MSHHYSGPNWGFPHGDARLDLTDLYAFPKPGDAGKSILIMNVHPSVRDISTARTRWGPPPELATEALYELKIDTDENAVADIAYRVRSRPPRAGRPRRCAALKARRPPGRATAGRLSLRGRRSRPSGGAGDPGRRLPLLRGLAQRSLFLRQAGRLEQPAVHRRRLLRRPRRVQHRVGSA